MAPLLRVEGLTKRFRGVVAAEDIHFSLDSGQIRAVIGPNGAGKTTFISMISGHVQPSGGEIFYQEKDITRLSVMHRARIGIARKFQTPTLFDNLSALQNIELAVLAAGLPKRQRHQRIRDVLQIVRLLDEAEMPAVHLSHGQRQWLEIGLLIAVRAKVLLLDEPTAGMTAEETAATGGLIHRLAREFELSAIIIEHDINFIRDLGAPVTVLHLGRVLMEGSFEEVAANPDVREVYLGGAA